MAAIVMMMENGHVIFHDDGDDGDNDDYDNDGDYLVRVA